MRYRTRSAFSNQPRSKVRISKQGDEAILPFAWASSPEAVHTIPHDGRNDADWRHHKGHSARHVLNGLEAALAARPGVVDERVDANVEVLKCRYLALECPRLVVDLYVRKLEWPACAYDAEGKRMLTTQVVENWEQRFEIPRSRWRANPADDRLCDWGPRPRLEAVSVDNCGDDADVPRVLCGVLSEVLVACEDKVGARNQPASRLGPRETASPTTDSEMHGIVEVENKRTVGAKCARVGIQRKRKRLSVHENSVGGQCDYKVSSSTCEAKRDPSSPISSNFVEETRDDYLVPSPL
ncbi:MAG: hypothetical protein Q8N26_36845 [Myxococcales bacterium]|nr:hypothetical protein [Myxococcales bacterium]